MLAFKKGKHILQNNHIACHPELVELSPSEERGESKAPKHRRDLAWNLGGF